MRQPPSAAPLTMLAANCLTAALWAASTIGNWGVIVFCGANPPDHCVEQMGLFAIASLIPALLALTLMVTAFTAPSLRARSGLRAQTLAYALIAWLIAGGTFILGGLPAI